MKTSPLFSDKLVYSLGEISRLKRDLLHEADIASCDRERIDKSFRTTKIKHESGVRLARTIEEKAAILFYELVKYPIARHKPKMMALIALLMYLYTHGYWLKLPHRELVTLIWWIEKSHPLTQKETIEGVRKIFTASLSLIK